MPINKLILDQLKANNNTLNNLDLNFSELSIEELQEIIACLSNNTHLAVLNVSGNPIGNAGIKLLTNSKLQISTLIASDCNITSLESFDVDSKLLNLDLTNNAIDINSAILLGKSQLESLLLASNHCSDDVAIAIAKSNTLTSLTLSHNHIGIVGADALSKNTSVKKLILNYNQIQTDGAIAFSTNHVIEYLGLAGNGISEKGIISLAHNNIHLTTLDVSYNFVNDNGFAALGTHPSLISLNVGYNQITFKGAQDFVSNNKSLILKTLIICHNLLGDSGAIALFKHASIENLDMAGNGIGFPGARAGYLNKKVRCLTISTNLLGDTGGIMIAQNETITELYASYNGIGDAAASVFAENQTLRMLNLNYNMVTETGRKLLLDNKSIIKLTISEEQPPEFTNENLDTIFLLSESFLCISDHTGGTLQFFNPAFSRVLGYSNDELLAKSAYNFLHPKDRAAQKHRGDEKTPIHYFENRYQCADGSYVTIQWTSRIKGNRRYAVGSNITEYRQNEQAASVAQLMSDSNLLKESQENARRQANFIAQLSHELRNPLSGISGLLDICIQQIIDLEFLISIVGNIDLPEFQTRLVVCAAELKENLQNMIICAEYQKAILNDNLDIVKMTENNFQLEQRPFELKKIISDVLPMMNAKAMKKEIKINTVVPEQKEIWVQGDALRLKQILMNLLGNAIKFTEKGSIGIGLLIIESTLEFIRIQISISDTGIGLSKENQQRLFSRFSQAHHSSEGQYEGSGLGLYLAKQMAIAMHGDITVVSELGEGSTFTAEVQLANLTAKQKVDADEKNENIGDLSTLSIPASLGLFAVKPANKYTILVVDDNALNRRILIRMLKATGHTCIEAINGQGAVDVYSESHDNETNKIDLILMDVQMPVKDGIEATIEIRELERKFNWKRTPIFAITADALKEAQLKGLTAGMDLYLIKPVVRHDLLSAIGALKIFPELEIARAYTF
jgi:PAS domain S-box-containing protein